jgi:hypothetical protein
VRGARRAIKAQAIALWSTFGIATSAPTMNYLSIFGNKFPARAKDIDDATAPTTSSQMAPKRPSAQENSGRQNKKRKITAARSISVQGVGGLSRFSRSNDSNGQ